ncbi:MAG: M23 family metallopeptidase [Bdellovibrionaceae bacterium]|jgi:murein DD-endopeptidase MepM/ murein hydrolase activator NlpD|nr:M23 family metallopeptidase [Pseudobdellovibrionaceae bacterium]
MKTLILTATFALLTTSCSTTYRAPRGYKSPDTYSSPNKYLGPKYRSAQLSTNQKRTSKIRPQHGIAFIWPINKAKLSQKFSPSHNTSHAGIDLASHRGTPILAAHEGTIIFAGKKYRGYGNMIIIERDDDWGSLYAHLDKLYIKSGEYVKQGEVIGTMGRTGRATGVHLHFELIYQKIPVDPIPHLRQAI